MDQPSMYDDDRLRVGWLNVFHSSLPQGHAPEQGSARAEVAQGTPTQSHASPNIF
jgi:hypothetical protein